jgi:iron complex outermembrane receptor protein
MRTPITRPGALSSTAARRQPPLLAALAAALLAGPALAQAPAETIVISGNGIERRAFDAPVAVTVINADALRDAGPMVNLSEALTLVPGLVANARNNYAQDLHLSSRG